MALHHDGMHEDFMMVPTDFLSISRSMDTFGSIEDYENFTLELFTFLTSNFPAACLAQREIYPESIGCDIQYLQGDSEELYAMCIKACKELGIKDLTIESDLFQTHRDEILESICEESFDWDYDREEWFVHVRQIIQDVTFMPDMSYEDFAKATETMATTIIQSGLDSKANCTLEWVPTFFYSIYRTNYHESAE